MLKLQIAVSFDRCVVTVVHWALASPEDVMRNYV
jgi:hypothetical protein